MRWIASALALLLVGCACGDPIPEEPTTPTEPAFESAGKVTIVYTNNIDGEIEPCG